MKRFNRAVATLISFGSMMLVWVEFANETTVFLNSLV